MTPVEKLQLKNAALRVLHAPGGPLSGGASARPASGIASGNAQMHPGMSTAHPGVAPLEMSLIFDGALSKEAAKTAGAEIVAALKSADEIFRNVRCNVVFWLSDEKIIHEPTAAAMVQMGRCFENWEQLTGRLAAPETEPAAASEASRFAAAPKRLELLVADLKKFEARSRLHILVTDGGYVVEDPEALQQNLNPFLRHRLLVLTPKGIRRGSELL